MRRAFVFASRSPARSRRCVSGVSIDIHQKCNLAIQAHKDAAEKKVSFFLVYKILITSLDLDLAKKSSDAGVFKKEPLVLNSDRPAPRKGQGTEMGLCLCNKQYNTLVLPMHNCLAYLSGKLWFVMTSLDPLLHCLQNMRRAFISYNAPARALICPWNIMKCILLLLLLSFTERRGYNPFYVNAGIN